MITARVDEKGRLVVPKRVREENHIEPGDIYVLQEDSDAGTITFVRMQNEVLRRIAEGEAEYEAGLTKSLDEVAAELGIDLQRG